MPEPQARAHPLVVVSAEEQAKIALLAQRDGPTAATKYAQALTRTSLDQSRDTVRRILDGVPAASTAAEAEQVGSDLATRARDIRAVQGSIAAIKMVQQETGASLVKSKAFVDAIA